MTKRVLLLLADGFEPLEAAGFTDVLGWANLDGEEGIELVSAGLRSPLKATFGFSVLPQALVADLDLDGFDAVAVPGGFEGAGFYNDALSQPFTDIIRRFVERQQTVAAVCVASLSLGAAGVLNGRRATVYHQIGGKRRAQLEGYGAQFVDEAVVVDGTLITSTGPGTAIEVAFELLTTLTSQANSDHIRKLMRIPEPAESWRRTPQVP
ncbi:DJ-1/PfpI family protein [Sphingomonas sp. H39-1-10]|uniref:DJ-1/PfpI family protein n=1 Tax=Sphingomonadales TaxID=204457 RepID=UPI000C200938|nr:MULTISPECIES: DJ-1/PfpI family protein [Sphingomonadaceae]MDF0490082.1 DJ-1/PfpI family protein [Sphingomonas pollutisoli]PJG45494.1 DJ-1 family protein [Sphingobium sp. LB126]PJG47114.1 DJ-1 family protein [Sphingobium sp. LB126]